MSRPGTVAVAALLLVAAGCAGDAPAAGAARAHAPAAVVAGLTPADLDAFFGPGLQRTDRGSFGLAQAGVVDAPDVPGGRALRVGYPAGSASRAAGGPDGGLQVYLRLPAAREELHLQYLVRFPDGFDFVKGGKLPGLFGGTATSGGNIPDGTDGFSTRYMWRRDGAGEVYAYLPTSQENGTSLGRGCWSFRPGRWTTMQQRVRLNTPGRADGELRVWQDGRPVLAATDLDFRSVPSLGIDGVFFSTFFGGGDTSWASPVDQYADFAGFVVSDGPVPPAADPAPDRTCGAGGP